MRHLDRFDSTSAPDDAKKAISFGATYTEIYARISAGRQALGATVTVCGKMSMPPR
jgi:hypothetical protein